MPPPEDKDRRRKNRLAIKLPVRVRGRDSAGATWEEVAVCLDATEGGLTILMARALPRGQVVHLSLPLPSRYRRYDLAASSYQIYGLVRTSFAHEGKRRVGVMFLGANPPQGSEALPSALYFLPGDQVDDRPTVRLVLEAADAPGGLAQQERAVVERLDATEAVVRIAALPVGRGSVVTLEDPETRFRTRAEVASISLETKGYARLVMRVVGPAIPEKLRS